MGEGCGVGALEGTGVLGAFVAGVTSAIRCGVGTGEAARADAVAAGDGDGRGAGVRAGVSCGRVTGARDGAAEGVSEARGVAPGRGVAIATAPAPFTNREINAPIPRPIKTMTIAIGKNGSSRRLRGGSGSVVRRLRRGRSFTRR
ncbi:MAG: hypothetical protein JOZ38_09645 [Candidatus Eremiobacteraeota bacterium]|nr:hypothetical protein [Candidatus Eremiobacteraeota bacterium]